MSCPCGLTKAEVLVVAEKHNVPLIAGKCQNPLANGSDGVCGMALGAHPISQSSSTANATEGVNSTRAEPSVSRKRRWTELNAVLEDIVNKSRKADKSSTPYSSVEWSDIRDILSIQPWDLRPTAIDESIVTNLHSQLLECNSAFGSLVSGKESKRLYFIAPILIAVSSLFKDDVDSKVLILVEEDVNGINIKTNGHFEFVLQKGNRRVCIVEAKKEQMEKGMAQSLLGCEAIVDTDNVQIVYAVVTNYLEWIFMKNTDDYIFRSFSSLKVSNDIPELQSVAFIAGCLYTLLLGG